MSHDFVAPGSSLLWANYWMDVKFFDDAGELQVMSLDLAAGWASSDLEQQANTSRLAFMELKFIGSGEIINMSRVYSISDVLYEGKTYTLSELTP